MISYKKARKKKGKKNENGKIYTRIILIIVVH